MSLVNRLPGQRALAVVAIAAAVTAAWHLGTLHGQRGHADLGPSLGAAAAQPTDSHGSPAQLARELAVERATVRTLRDRLAAAERMKADDAAELALYRRIGAESARTGLGIDAVQVREGASGRSLDITLVQARGRDRVAGTLGVSILSADEPAQRVELAPDSGDDALAFDLRFFETLSVPLGQTLAASGITPDRLSISVQPASGKHPAFVDIRDWDTIVSDEAAE